MYNKRTLYSELYKALYPNQIVAYSTISGYRTLQGDPLLVDYDILVAIDPSQESKTWLQISDLTSTPYIIMRINEFYIYYHLGASFNDVADEKPSVLNQPTADQQWVKNMMAIIDKAFASAV